MNYEAPHLQSSASYRHFLVIPPQHDAGKHLQSTVCYPLVGDEVSRLSMN